MRCYQSFSLFFFIDFVSHSLQRIGFDEKRDKRLHHFFSLVKIYGDFQHLKIIIYHIKKIVYIMLARQQFS